MNNNISANTSFISFLMSTNIMKWFIGFLENKMKDDYETGKMIIDCNIKPKELKKRLNNTLVLCNHDAGGFDFMAISYYLSSIMGIDLSVVANEFFRGLNNKTTFMEDIAEKYNIGIIFRGKATQKIIDNINEGGTVMMFYNPYSWKNMNNNKSLKKIIEETNCKPVYIKYYFDININKIKEEKIIKESSGVGRYAIKVICKLLAKNKDPVSIHIDISKKYNSYEDFINNKDFLKPYVLE
jgi:hypothetical protein